MIFRFLFFFGLVLSAVSAQAQHEIQIYIPGVQFRYEENYDQSIDLRSYTHYAANYMYKSLLLGIEHNRAQENSGSSSLGVKTEIKETNFLAGASVAKLEFKNLMPNANIELIVFGLMGQTKSDIETTLVGQAHKDSSETNSVLGLGGLILFRLEYIIAGVDTRYMQSQAFEPNGVSVSTIKLGANFDF